MDSDFGRVVGKASWVPLCIVLTMGYDFRRCDLEESELIFSLGSPSRTYVTAYARLYTK